MVSREAKFYQIPSNAQGSAIDTAQGILLHGACEMQNMLLMVWEGESRTQSRWQDKRNAARKSRAEIREYGVRHGEIPRTNILWNLRTCLCPHH